MFVVKYNDLLLVMLKLFDMDSGWTNLMFTKSSRIKLIFLSGEEYLQIKVYYKLF